MNYAPPPHYEFNEAQTAVIAKLASRLRLAGLAQIVFGLCDFLGSCHLQRSEGAISMTSSSSPFDIALVIAGAFMISSAASFSKIVSTRGWDMSHLMLALRSYSRSVLVQFIAYVVMAVLFVIAVALILLVLLVFAAFLHELSGGTK
jgi:hypothetical protein